MIDKNLTRTKKAVERNDLSTKSESANATTVTETLATGLGTESQQQKDEQVNLLTITSI